MMRRSWHKEEPKFPVDKNRQRLKQRKRLVDRKYKPRGSKDQSDMPCCWTAALCDELLASAAPARAKVEVG